MRSYQQFCGLARALDLVGERWTLLVVRELLLGPRRYSDLLEHLPGITTNLLARRLRHLTQAGLVEKVPLSAPARGEAYALTVRGRQLETPVLELGRFGSQFLGAPEPDDTLDVGWLMISLKRRISPTPRHAVVEFHIAGEGGDEPTRTFQWRLGDRPDVREGRPWRADAVVTGPFSSLRGILFGAPERRKGDRRLRLSGDPKALDVFFEALDAPGP